MHRRHLRSYAARVVLAGLFTIATTAPAFAQAGGDAAEPAAEGDPAKPAPEGDEPSPDAPTLPPPKTKAKEEIEKNPKKTKEVAEKAELTPIVPSPSNPFKPAFQLYAEIDIPVLAVGAVFAGARLIRTQKAYCAPLCDKSDLNALDRTTAGKYDTNWSLVSDFGVYSLMGGAGVLLFADEGPGPALNDAVVIAQSALLATALSTVLTLAAGRPRPFLYGEKAPLSVRNSSDAGLSFLSSHTSVSFAIATSSWMAMRRLEPNTAYPAWTLAVGLTIASSVGVARVMAGKHFITDVVGGAVVGSSTGVLVPALHSTPVKVVPQLHRDAKGVAIIGWF